MHPRVVFAGCGFTEFALRLLTVPRLQTTASCAKVFGGVDRIPEDMVQRCFARMANWVRLVISSLHAEFPGYELLQSFRIFRLDEAAPGTRPHGVVTESHAESVKRLAHVFKVDSLALATQLQDAMLFAKRCFQLSGNSMKAWKDTVAKMMDRRLQARHPMGALLPVLQRYIAFCGCTTSGVEQTFSVLRKLLGEQRLTMDWRTEVTELTIGMDSDACSRDELIASAQKIWCETYGNARTTTKDSQRFVSGTARPTQVGTEKAWKSLREDRIKALVASSCKRDWDNVVADAKSQGDPLWDENLEDEKEKLENKARRQRVEAAEFNLLLPSERDASLEADVRAAQKKRCQREREYARRDAKILQLTVQRGAINLDNMCVHLASTFPDATLTKLKNVVRQHNMQIVPERSQASILVVPDLAKPGLRTTLIALLLGKHIATDTFMLNHGENSPSIKYRAAIHSRRQIWMSPSFIREHIVHANIISDASRCRESRWTILPTEGAFLRIVLRGDRVPRRQIRNFDAVGIATASDKTGALASVRWRSWSCQYAVIVAPLRVSIVLH